MIEPKTYYKLLHPSGGTYYQGEFFAYALPAGDGWGPWQSHPEPAEPDGKGCGPGRCHFMKRLDSRYTTDHWWPWLAQVRQVIGESEEKISAAQWRLKRIVREEFWRIVREESKGANLRNADLQDADLRNADLRDANLQDANLWGADLRDANLWGADLQDADLGADLRNANLWNANLQDANLWGADLQDADLGADLQGAYGDSACGRIKDGELQ